jgi:N-acetylglucosamine-6-sulfatase
MKTRGLLVLAAAAAVAATALAAGFADAGAKSGPAVKVKRPNIILVLTDDLSWNLVKYMPHVKQMQRQGVTFGRYFVTDSLCCPSRASIFTGKFPHDTGIFTNGGSDGGFTLFHERGEEKTTFATLLHAAGYTTAMMGKYMNGYTPQQPVDGKRRYVPPGWDEWDVGGSAYAEFNYMLNENGRLVHYGNSPQDYLTDVVAGKGSAFIDRAGASGKPFLLEIATFAPHAPYTPAPRDENDFPDLTAPRTPAFNEADVSDKPVWLRRHIPLRTPQLSKLDVSFRKRAQAVESVDDMIGTLQATLARNNQLSNTYIFFTSDNGYHMGEHRLAAGKQTAFETDIRVPLIVTGPGVPRGRVVSRLTSNIDLHPTFMRLGHAPVAPDVDGRSLVPLLRRKLPKTWRHAVLVEHHGPDTNPSDPDFPARGSGNPTTYETIRLARETYVEYKTGEHEYYNLRRDPYQLTNTYSQLSTARKARLHQLLQRLKSCHSGAACWRAAR